MRKVARWIGGVWLLATFAAIMATGAWEMFHCWRGVIIPIWGGFGELYVFGALAVPGYLLFKWGEETDRSRPNA